MSTEPWDDNDRDSDANDDSGASEDEREGRERVMLSKACGY